MRSSAIPAVPLGIEQRRAAVRETMAAFVEVGAKLKDDTPLDEQATIVAEMKEIRRELYALLGISEK